MEEPKHSTRYHANLDVEVYEALAARLEHGDTIVIHHPRQQDAKRTKIHWHLYASRMKQLLGNPFWGDNVEVVMKGDGRDWQVTFRPLPPLVPIEGNSIPSPFEEEL